MEESNCPGKRLKRIIKYLNSERFELLCKEPGFREAEERAIRRNFFATDSEIQEVFREMVKTYDRRQRFARELHQYGSYLSEIRENLASHVFKCGECYRFYYGFLRKKAEIKLRGFREPSLCSQAELAEIEKMIDALDKEYLHLYSDSINS